MMGDSHPYFLAVVSITIYVPSNSDILKSTYTMYWLNIIEGTPVRMPPLEMVE